MKRNIWHIIIGGTIGNITEWYNFLLYGYLASTISQLFFPMANKLLSLSLAFTVFALSFFVRPIGGILFGWIGDTYGRQRALIISLIMIAVPTFLIGCLPTYSSLGIASPIILCVLRVCQGLSAGGEHTGSAVYLAEFAPAEQRALWVSTVPTSAALGILLSSLAALLLIDSFSSAELLAWGWRVGFWAGTVLCLISIALRITLPETPYFQKTHPQHPRQRYPISTLLKNPETLKSLFFVICLASTWGVYYQILFIWMPTYLTQIEHFTHRQALEINSLYMLLFAILILFFGYCADHLNRKLLLMVACVALLLGTYPLFLMIASGVLLQIFIAMTIFTILFSLYVPTVFVSMIEAFTTEIRFTGLSFGFNVGLALFGGTCPLIATWLIAATHSTTAPAFYMILVALVSLGATLGFSSKIGKKLV